MRLSCHEMAVPAIVVPATVPAVPCVQLYYVSSCLMAHVLVVAAIVVVPRHKCHASVMLRLWRGLAGGQWRARAQEDGGGFGVAVNSLLTRGTRVYTFLPAPDFKTLPSLLLIGSKKVRAVSHGRTHVINFKILKHQNIIHLLFVNIFINFSINTTIYAIIMAEPTIIKYSKYYIYKSRLNFVKDGPLKKLLKLC